MIQSIGFKNFRRFENFDDMKLGKINIFVGRNNAGKSTVMKAIELFKGNLKHLSHISNQRNFFASYRPMFVFDTDETAEIHIDSFERALYNKAERKEITLSAGYNDFHIDIVLDGENTQQEDSFVSVPYSSVHFWNEAMNVMFDFGKRVLVADFMNVSSVDDDELKFINYKIHRLTGEEKLLKSRIEHLKDRTVKSDDLVQAAVNSENNANIKSYERRLRSTSSLLKESYDRLAEIENEENKDIHILIENMPEYRDKVYVNIFQQVFGNLFEFANDESLIQDGRTKEGRNISAMQDLVNKYSAAIKKCAKSVEDNLTLFETEYISAHAASQNVIFKKGDTSDSLTRTLNEFCKQHIVNEDREWQFVTKWMNRGHFDIGCDFKIKILQGAGYMLKMLDEPIDKKQDAIDDPNDEKKLNLADKGVGTIQLMTLLLRLAVIMRNRPHNCTILIEEPEQNIHPMLQEKLADLLLDFHKECEDMGCDVQLVVETHSEYITRRVQVIVADANYKDDEDLKNNPFNIYYFDSYSKERPWFAMNFEITGGFKPGCEFGEGFYNTAADLDMKIILKEQTNQHFDF